VNLPKNVKIILSTLTGYFGIVETLQNMIEIPENFAQVSPFILVKLIFKRIEFSISLKIKIKGRAFRSRASARSCFRNVAKLQSHNKSSPIACNK